MPNRLVLAWENRCALSAGECPANYGWFFRNDS